MIFFLNYVFHSTLKKGTSHSNMLSASLFSSCLLVPTYLSIKHGIKSTDLYEVAALKVTEKKSKHDQK